MENTFNSSQKFPAVSKTDEIIVGSTSGQAVHIVNSQNPRQQTWIIYKSRILQYMN